MHNGKPVPSAVRVTRVEQYIHADPEMKELLKKEAEKNNTKIAIHKRDGTNPKFPVQLVEIAQLMADKGLDAATCSKHDILKYAAEYFQVEHVPASARASAGESAGHAAAEGDSSKKKSSGKEPEMNAATPITSLLLGAIQLCRFDNHAGADKRKKALEDLAKEYSSYA